MTTVEFDQRVFEFALARLVHDPSDTDAKIVVNNFSEFVQNGFDGAMTFCEFMAPLNPRTMAEGAEQNRRCDAYLRVKRKLEEE